MTWLNMLSTEMVVAMIPKLKFEFDGRDDHSLYALSSQHKQATMSNIAIARGTPTVAL